MCIEVGSLPKNVEGALGCILHVVNLVGNECRPNQRVSDEKPKQVWYDWDGDRARKKSFRYLNLYRNSCCMQAMLTQLNANKYFRQLCMNKKMFFI